MNILSTTWTHMRRSPYQTLAALVSMFLTFLLAGFFFVTSVGSFFILRYFEGKPQITVFFTDKTSNDEASALQKKLEATGKTASIKYVSKEGALSIFREQNKKDPLLLEMVTADILPASLEVSAKDPTYLNDLNTEIKGAPGVEEVVFQKDVVDTLLSWTLAIRAVGLVLGGLLALNALLIVATVIGMKIALKKTEVEILKLVGASPWYIRMPFLTEGGLYGVVGASFSFFIILCVFLWVRPMLFSFLGIVPVIAAYLSNPLSVSFVIVCLAFWGGLALSGFLLGALGSLIAVGRYLRT